MDWYYAENGQQLGPLDNEGIRERIRAGEITLDTLIWRAGWAEWQPMRQTPFANEAMPVRCPTCGALVPERDLIPMAGTHICPNCQQTQIQRMNEGLPLSVAGATSGGTGGQTPVTELMKQASNDLSGRWGIGIGFCVVWYLVLMAAGLIPVIGNFVQWFIQGPLTIGLCCYFLAQLRGENRGFDHMFEGFKHYGSALGLFFLILVITIGVVIPGGIPLGIGMFDILRAEEMGTTPSDTSILLTVIGGILIAIGGGYISLRYSQIWYLMADNPRRGVMETLKASAWIMRGNYLKLIWAGIIMVFLSILGALTLLVGFLFLAPLINAMFARIYQDLLPPEGLE